MLTDKFKKISRIAILAACGVLLVYDIIAQLWGGTNATLSRAIWDLSSEAPFIPFLAGFFAGHLFWPGKHSKFDEPIVKGANPHLAIKDSEIS